VKLVPSSHRLFSLLLLTIRLSQQQLLLSLLPLSLCTPVQLPLQQLPPLLLTSRSASQHELLLLLLLLLLPQRLLL
jgi:hypothetical protein